MSCEIARRQVLFLTWLTALVCAAFFSCEWGGKESQQFHQRLVFISQSMFKSNRYSDYLSIFDRDLRLMTQMVSSCCAWR